jgi:hypothetical protein
MEITFSAKSVEAQKIEYMYLKALVMHFCTLQ